MGARLGAGAGWQRRAGPRGGCCLGLHPLLLTLCCGCCACCRAHKRAKEAASKAGAAGDPDGVPVGTYVQLQVAGVPADVAARVLQRVAASCQEAVAPLVVFGLLQHECKLSVQVRQLRQGGWRKGRREGCSGQLLAVDQHTMPQFAMPAACCPATALTPLLTTHALARIPAFHPAALWRAQGGCLRGAAALQGAAAAGQRAALLHGAPRLLH